MKVKGFIVEDDQGRELVLVCERLSDCSATMFALRGWQRRRLVPLQYTEQEHRQIVAQVLLTLNDLFVNLPSLFEEKDVTAFENGASPADIVKATMDDEEDRVMN